MRSIVYNCPKPRNEPGHEWLPLWTTTLDRGHHIQGWVSVRVTKGPRMRFHPGQLLKHGKQLYEVIYVYRTEEAPSEWVYNLEERPGLAASDRPVLQATLEDGLGVGKDTLRVVHGVFLNDHHAYTYFSDIYRAADTLRIRNGVLLSDVQVVSSGTLEDSHAQ